MKGVLELQRIDSNCNNCKHLIRSFSKRQKSIDFSFREQKRLFDGKRIKILEKVEHWINKGETEKAKLLLKEANKMNFQHDTSDCAISYGTCSKLNKDVSFIPNIMQLDTQECFVHRKD